MLKSYRVMHKFWLDITKDQEDRLDEQIHDLKRDRKFAGTIRDALRLILDLRMGRLDVLFELFPWAKIEFLDGLQPAKSTGEQALEVQLKRLEALMMGQGSTPIQLVSSVPANGGPKPLAAPQFTPPAFANEDDDFRLDIRKDASSSASHNFITSMLKLQSSPLVEP